MASADGGAKPAAMGGKGSVVGTLLAAVLLGSFTFAMGMLNVTGIVVSMVVGGLLIVAMVLPQYLRRIAAPALRHRLRRDPLDDTDASVRVDRVVAEIFGA